MHICLQPFANQTATHGILIGKSWLAESINSDKNDGWEISSGEMKSQIAKVYFSMLTMATEITSYI